MRRRRRLPSQETKKEPWLDGPKALVISTAITATVELIKHFWKQKWVSGAKAPKLTNSIAYLGGFVMKDKKFWNVACWSLTGVIWVYFIWKWFFQRGNDNGYRRICCFEVSINDTHRGDGSGCDHILRYIHPPFDSRVPAVEADC